MNNRFNQLGQLSLEEWRILFASTALLPLTALSLRMNGLIKTRDMMNEFIPSHVKNKLSKEDHFLVAQRVARIVNISANHGPYKGNCLKKSLVTWWLLARKGIETDLKIGVNKNESDFQAHAWVELNDNALIDSSYIRNQFSEFYYQPPTNR